MNTRMFKTKIVSVKERLPNRNGLYEIAIGFNSGDSYCGGWIFSEFDIKFGWLVNVENEYIAGVACPTIDKIEVIAWVDK